MHRVIKGAKAGQSVDHVNGNGLDNRRSNLRLCAHAENLRNRKIHKNNKSGFKGVRKRKESSLWRAEIRSNHKFYFLGNFHSAEEAAHAYDAAALKLHGEFARLNFPRD